jgi:F420-dependent oxidoreductase-like protein
VNVCLMIEGQENVSWASWRVVAAACERYGFSGLFTSDHYSSESQPAAHDSLDSWTVLAALAALTSDIRLGTLVSPIGFRHPSVLAKAAVTVDHVSRGRVEVGLGGGWDAREHAAYGFPFRPTTERWDELEEQLEILVGQWTQTPYSFRGKYYVIADVEALPKPVQAPRPPLILGGVGRRRSVALAARFVDEYNLPEVTLEQCATVRGDLDRACAAIGRNPNSLGLSLMTTCVLGDTDVDARRQMQTLAATRGEDAGAFDGRWLVGTPSEVVRQLQDRASAGVRRVMLSIDHEDLLTIQRVGREIIPAL